MPMPWVQHSTMCPTRCPALLCLCGVVTSSARREPDFFLSHCMIPSPPPSGIPSGTWDGLGDRAETVPHCAVLRGGVRTCIPRAACIDGPTRSNTAQAHRSNTPWPTTQSTTYFPSTGSKCEMRGADRKAEWNETSTTEMLPLSNYPSISFLPPLLSDSI